MADEPKKTPEPSPATAAPKPEAPPAAAAAKPAAPAPPPKPAGPVPMPWESEVVARLKSRFGSGIQEASTYLGQNYVIADRSVVFNVLQALRDEEQFDYNVDITAVHYPQREKQFDVLWVLYSFARNERMRVKTRVAEGESAPSAVPLWEGANWLER